MYGSSRTLVLRTFENSSGSEGARMRAKIFVLAVLTAGSLSMLSQSGPKAQEREAKTGAVAIQMKNVRYRIANDVVLEVRSLRGDLVPTKPGVPVTFDDQSSF